MKKILDCNCQLYSVDEAKFLGSVSSYGIQEELYQKKTGEFFLNGKGGPSTKYAKHCCGNLIAGNDVTPLTCESAQKWVKKNLSADEYKNIFGEVL